MVSMFGAFSLMGFLLGDEFGIYDLLGEVIILIPYCLISTLTMPIPHFKY